MHQTPKRYLRPTQRAMESASAAFLVGHLIHEKIVAAGIAGRSELHGARDFAFQIGCDIVLKDWLDQGGPEKVGREFCKVCAELIEQRYEDDTELPNEVCVYTTARATDVMPGGSPRVGPRERTLADIHGDALYRGIDLDVFEQTSGK